MATSSTSKLKVGSIYNLYTKHSSIVNTKVEVIGILKYSECSKYPYDMAILAINERVISLKEEDLESHIGNDNIYYLRSTTANLDGTYNEFIVWDSIINYEKTIAVNEEYIAQMKIEIPDTSSYSVSQIIESIENFVSTTYGTEVTFSIGTATSSSDSDSSSNSGSFTEEQLEKIEGILNTISSFENTLVPAAEKISTLDLAGTLQDIGNDLTTIKGSIALARRSL